MANKYIRHGATYNGDGTTSAEAASDGAAGAWNTITYFEGTAPAYGTLVAGDTVYIRSKDAAGADITRTIAANTSLGSAAGSADSPIRWVLDAGTIWSGINGVLTYTNASNYTTTILANNIVSCETDDALTIRNTSATPASGNTLCRVNGHLINAKLDFSAKTNSNNLVMLGLGDGAHVANASILIGAAGTTLAYSSYGMISSITGTTRAVLVNPKIVISGTSVGQVLFGPLQYTTLFLDVYGGYVSGSGATATGAKLADAISSSGFSFSAVGFKVPRTMLAYGGYGLPSVLNLVACEDNYGGHTEAIWGYATTRTDNNPPTLNASLPDVAGTKWAIRVYPYAASSLKPMALPFLKANTNDTGVRTITLELLVSDDFTTAPNTSTLWINVEYVDDETGEKVNVSSRTTDANTLTSSTADWSSTTWGMVSLTKRKLSITTPTAVKSDRAVMVTLCGICKATSSTAVLFVDPDFRIE